MDIFEFNNYQKYLKEHLQKQPNQGYGQAIKIAKALNTSPSIVSQVLKGNMEFTLEQGSDLCEFLALNELESEYLLNLITYQRAGTARLKDRLRKKLEALKERSRELSERIPAQASLTEEDKALFYSQWYYSGIRLATSIDKYQTVDALSELFHLPKATVRSAVDFLLAKGLCVREEDLIKMGPQSTHVGNASPLVNRHHSNWRQKAMERMSSLQADELFFTSPVSIAEKDLDKVRKVLLKAVEDSFKIIDPSPSETLACLNIDFFRLI